MFSRRKICTSQRKCLLGDQYEGGVIWSDFWSILLMYLSLMFVLIWKRWINSAIVARKHQISSGFYLRWDLLSLKSSAYNPHYLHALIYSAISFTLSPVYCNMSNVLFGPCKHQNLNKDTDVPLWSHQHSES